MKVDSLNSSAFFNTYLKAFVHLSNEGKKYRDKLKDVRRGLIDSFEVTDSEISELDNLLQEIETDDQLLNKTVELNMAGIAFEKEGEINSAIKCYEENINLGYLAPHSYNRLMVLYRKLKLYHEEIRIINKAIAAFRQNEFMVDSKSYIEKLEKRLIKAKNYLQTSGSSAVHKTK